jgi:signal transduction histidine kinase
MKIRDKLLLGFGLYTFFALILGVLAYNELRTISTRLIVVEVMDDMTNNLLEVRRAEKNYLLYKDKDSLDDLMQHLEALRENIDNVRSEIIKDMGMNDYRRIKEAIVEYKGLLEKAVAGDKESANKMRTKAREIQAFTESLSKRERADINDLVTKFKKLLLFALLVILSLGIAVNINLSRSIAAPIKNLEGATKKIAEGDFSTKIEVKGEDEIASLSASFNQMEIRLQELMKSLELAVQRLHEQHVRLIETEKLATLGKFSAGVAHEINNPLAIINEKAGLIMDIIGISEDFPNKDKFYGLLNAILDSVNRCRGITHRILGFARRADIAIEPVDLNNLIGDVLKFLENEIELKCINMTLDLDENMPVIESEKIQLQQAFLNILKNAVDAVDYGGKIRIAAGAKDEGAVSVSVRDNGHGISGETLKHIFEPFFTTKEKGKGTGLGLSITYGIIKRLGGNIFVESEPAEGTTFTIELPVKAKLHGGETV